MANLAICRVCLSHNTKMYFMRNTELETFQLFTGIKLNKEDGKPKTLCYICFSQLRICIKFRDMSRASEKRLTQFFHKGYPLTIDTVTLLNRKGAPVLLSLAQIQHTSLDDCQNSSIIVKEEHTTSNYSINLEENCMDDIKTEDETTKTQNSTQFILEMYLRAEKEITPNIEKVILETSTEPFNTNYDTDNDDNTKETDECVSIDSNPFKHFKKSIGRNQTQSIKEMNTKDGPLEEEIIAKHNTIIDDNTKQTVDEGVTKSLRYPCEQCNKSFTLKCRLKSHMRTHTGEKPYVCTKCDKKYSSALHVKNHMETHEEAKNNECKICGKLFFLRSNMTRHMKSHTDDKPTCEKCNKTFKNNDTLRNHIKFHNNEKRHVCDICSKAFAKKSVLMSHMKIHTGEKPYPCNKCGKKFTMLSYLNGHIHRVHTDKKPYACEMCGKTFSESGYLKRHMRIHTGEKPYACVLCDKTFAYYTNMKLHVLTHTGETPFSCHLCGKTFTQQSSMKQHIKIVHFRVRPYGCDVCPKTYSKRTNLLLHMRSHTGERPYNCDKCNKTFGRLQLYKRHLKIHSRTAAEQPELIGS